MRCFVFCSIKSWVFFVHSKYLFALVFRHWKSVFFLVHTNCNRQICMCICNTTIKLKVERCRKSRLNLNLSVYISNSSHVRHAVAQFVLKTLNEFLSDQIDHFNLWFRKTINEQFWRNDKNKWIISDKNVTFFTHNHGSFQPICTFWSDNTGNGCGLNGSPSIFHHVNICIRSVSVYFAEKIPVE